MIFSKWVGRLSVVFTATLGIFSTILLEGCGSKSIPPYPPPLNVNSFNLPLLDKGIDPESGILHLEIIGLRNAKYGLYIDMLVIGEHAHDEARKIGGAINLGNQFAHSQPSQFFEIRNCDGELLSILLADLDYDEYVKPDIRFKIMTFIAPPYISEYAMAGPTYDLPVTSDHEQVIQVISVRTPEQFKAGCYQIRFLPEIQSIADTQLDYNLDWHRFDTQQP